MDVNRTDRQNALVSAAAGDGTAADRHMISHANRQDYDIPARRCNRNKPSGAVNVRAIAARIDGCGNGVP